MNEAGEVYSEERLQAALTGIPSGNDVPVSDVLVAVWENISTMQAQPNSPTISPFWSSVIPDKYYILQCSGNFLRMPVFLVSFLLP